MKAMWQGAVIAESDDTVIVEGNHYFPRESLNAKYFSESSRMSACPWKGTASYLDIVVDEARNDGAAWFYANPKPAVSEIEGRVAFWKGVEVVDG